MALSGFWQAEVLREERARGRMRMDTGKSMLVMAGICMLVLAIGFLRRKAEIVLNFAVRAILGTMAIYVINLMLEGAGLSVAAGIGPLSVLTVGSLGTGGLALIYGILFYNML